MKAVIQQTVGSVTYFDPRLDVIEEDALNEKSCLQVLKILINKADSEIVELEDELMLQRQLTCEDYMCFAALNKKIVNMDGMLRALKNENQQPAETTQDDRYASEQETKEYSSKPLQQRVKAVQINDPSGMKGQKVVHTETDCTIEDTRPRLLNSKSNVRSKPRKKLKLGGEDYGDKTIKATQQQLAGAKRIGGFADISATSQTHLRKRSGAPVIQENKDQRNVRNRLVKTHGRTSQEPPVIIPSPGIADIDNMSLVQLKALANQNNIYGVSITRKADLQQLLRSKLQAKDFS